jgi:hypothetical protein
MGKHDDQVDALTQFVEWAASPRGEARQRRNPETGRPILVRRQSIARPMRWRARLYQLKFPAQRRGGAIAALAS